MRCHTGPEKQRGSSALRAYASLRKHTRAAKHLVATCCTNATETRCATLAATEGSGDSRSRRARRAMTDTTDTLFILGRIDAIRRIVKIASDVSARPPSSVPCTACTRSEEHTSELQSRG